MPILLQLQKITVERGWRVEKGVFASSFFFFFFLVFFFFADQKITSS